MSRSTSSSQSTRPTTDHCLTRATREIHSDQSRGPQAIAIAVPHPLAKQNRMMWMVLVWVAVGITSLIASVALGQTQSGQTQSGQTQSGQTKPGQPKASSVSSGEELAILAGGCFWCTEAVYERMEGVNDVVSGYIGGHVKNPTYEQVCGKKTGHAEAVQVYYDPSKTSFEELLVVFFKIHDPTTLNRQGVDSGPQYRSSIFYQNDEQKKIAENYIKKLNKSGDFRNPIVTLLEPNATFYVAEEYHQDYYRRNPNAGYCRAVVANKVRKFNRSFGDKIKDDLK
ncbi:peptide-methionine (S)-S-oxide reductase MsrA [Neorhodopirellula lusitana]|uniref:peptide-methionine (S)-S-oxide reductase MsrA n=1 Tax=Neorhodopirellula lusitana TaxID=445327 RepID=UPI00384D8D5A